MRAERREPLTEPTSVIDATPLEELRGNTTGDRAPVDANFGGELDEGLMRGPGEGLAPPMDSDCKCPPPPPGDKARNLVVCIDGTANQFGEKVSYTHSKTLDTAQLGDAEYPCR